MMKRLLLLIYICLSAVSCALAQQQLHVGKYFGQNTSIADRPSTTEIIVSGTEVKKYGLKYYHSLTFEATATEIDDVSRLVEKDLATATGKQLRRLGGRIVVAFCQVGTKNGIHQYLLFKNAQPQKQDGAKLTIIYMEGPASAEKLRKHLRF